jgi:hypothetical protein
MKLLMSLLFCLSATVAIQASAVSLQDVVDSYADRLTISPVEYNGLPVDSFSALAVCQLAGYQLLISTVDQLYTGDRYGITAYNDTFSFYTYSGTQEILLEVQCARR